MTTVARRLRPDGAQPSKIKEIVVKHLDHDHLAIKALCPVLTTAYPTARTEELIAMTHGANPWGVRRGLRHIGCRDGDESSVHVHWPCPANECFLACSCGHVTTLLQRPGELRPTAVKDLWWAPLERGDAEEAWLRQIVWMTRERKVGGQTAARQRIR